MRPASITREARPVSLPFAMSESSVVAIERSIRLLLRSSWSISTILGLRPAP